MRALLLLLFAVYAQAATCTNTGAASSASATNWDCGHAPLSADTVVATSAGTVTLTASVSYAMLYYSAGSTVTIACTSTCTVNGPIQPAPSSPPTFASPATIQSDVTGSNVPGVMTSSNLSLTNVHVKHMGAYSAGVQAYGITYTGGTGSTLAISQATFDTSCGLKIGSGWNANDQWSVANWTNKLTPAGCQNFSSGAIGFVTPNIGKLKQMTNVVFDAPVTIGSRRESYSNALFLNGWTESIFTDFANPYTVGGYSLARLSWQGANCTTLSGNNGLSVKGAALDHVLMIGDSSTCIAGAAPAALTPLVTGTATSATSTTIVDSTKAWTVNQFASNGTSTDWFISITGGTGAGQVQTSEANTATSITPRYPWDTQPDATSTYAIYAGVANAHWTNGPTLTTGNTVTHQYVMFGLWGAADNNGDVWHAMTCPSGAGGSGVAINSGTYVLDHMILMPSLMRDNSGTPLTSNNCYYKKRHNTYFTGAQSIGVNEGGLNQTAGAFLDFSGNLSWAGTRTYKSSGGGAAVATLGPWYLVDEILASGATDVVAANCYGGSASCADYNSDFHALQTGRAATDRPGSNPAYNVKTSVIMGAHDVRSTDPQLSNPWATPQSWAQSLGVDTGVSDPIAILPDVYSRMMSVFDFSPTDSRFTTVALWNYLGAAMTPGNAALHSADSDGTDIGAFALNALAVAPTSLSFTCTSGGSVPGSQSVAVSATGFGVLDNRSATKTQSWLTLTGASGSSAGSFTVAPDCSGLAAGSYSDNITVATTTSGIVGSPIVIPVSVTAIAGPAISTLSLPDGAAGSAYSQTLAVVGGQAAFTWSISAGALCPGLSINASTGVISGTPPVAATCSFTARVTDSNLATGTRPLGITIVSSPGSTLRGVTTRGVVVR